MFETYATLDPRLILWPHVSTELVRTVMANQMDVTKLHALIPAECRSSLELRIQQDEVEDNAARLSRLFGLRDDDETTKQVKLSKVAKHFPLKETFVAALLVWKGIKLFYGTSLPKAFGPTWTFTSFKWENCANNTHGPGLSTMKLRSSNVITPSNRQHGNGHSTTKTT